jgi:hypothetical protein
MKVVALAGLPRSGKDTAADWFVLRGYTRLQFSGPLKEAAAVLLDRPLSHMYGEGYDREKIMPEWGFSVRWFLQRFGTECLREQIRPDFWLLRMARAIQRISPAPVVITDLRFENEAEMVRGAGGIIIELRRPGIVGSSHASDAGVRPDCTIDNDGTLADLADRIASTMLEYHHAATSRRPAP